MNDHTIWEIVYLFWVIVAFGLTWWRLVWAIKRGAHWEKTAEYRLLNWRALDREMYVVVRELAEEKKLREELLEYVDQSEDNDEYKWPEEEPPF